MSACSQYPTTKSPSFLVYEEDDIQEQEEEKSVCILGKVVTEKSIHRGFMQATLENVWCNPRNLIVKEIDTTIFKLSFDTMEDHMRILKGSPWIFFCNSWLILQEWHRKNRSIIWNF